MHVCDLFRLWHLGNVIFGYWSTRRFAHSSPVVRLLNCDLSAQEAHGSKA